MCKCPSCDSSYRKRLERNFLFKLFIPKSKFYKCYRCKSKFLNVPYLSFSLLLKKGNKVSSREIIKGTKLVLD